MQGVEGCEGGVEGGEERLLTVVLICSKASIKHSKGLSINIFCNLLLPMYIKNVTLRSVLAGFYAFHSV